MTARPATSMVTFRTPLERLTWIPDATRRVLREAGFRTVEDVLYHLPLRYEDWRTARPIGRLRPGETALVRGVVDRVEVQTTPRRRMKVVRIYVQDDSGTLVAVFFHQPYMARRYARGETVLAYGEVTHDREVWDLRAMHHPRMYSEAEARRRGVPGRLVPVYRRVGRLTSYQWEKLVQRLLDRLDPGRDPLPQFLRRRYAFPDRAAALRALHAPPQGPAGALADRQQEPAMQRLVYEDLFLLQLGLVLRRRLYIEEAAGIAFAITPQIEAMVQRLAPFPLTRAQQRVLREIFHDMQAPRPMHRLLQGDVGSGKTILAAMAMAVAAANGYQAVLMAPTELLAEQHAYRFCRLFAPLDIPVVLLTGGLRRRERQGVLAAIASGQARLIVGTHAVFQADVVYPRLGLVVIDEQHRFGVRHRARIRAKGQRPDTLVMTATPIPRSLALTVYGDLDVSVLDELPPGRQPVVTRRVTTRERDRVYRWLATRLAAGEQAYIVCPLIETSEKLQVQAATRLYEELRQGPLRDFPVGLVHGQVPREERERRMDAFQRGEIQALVATTVIEVGVDNPNATVMIVEHAERFGLAQLHQLRGRVGRGPRRSYCILITEPRPGNDALQRIRALCEHASGFDIADLDLRLRGPGELAGVRQTGLARLRVADLVRDRGWLPRIRRDAREYVDRLLGDGDPERRQEALRFLRQWARRYGLVQVG